MGNGQITTLRGRCMYIWKLRPVLTAERGIEGLITKAKKAKLAGVWIKVAEGASNFENIAGDMEQEFGNLCRKLAGEGISVWGWHVPYCKTIKDAAVEASLVVKIAQDYGLGGILMDAESGPQFFKGDSSSAEAYASKLSWALSEQGKGLAISSHDIPVNFPAFPFDSFAKHATVNAPQVYYGGSPSVDNRLNRAIKANTHLNIPFVPVGAGWVGEAGGCESVSACAERATIFMKLVREHGFPGYSFWHWGGVPATLWEVLFTEPV